MSHRTLKTAANVTVNHSHFDAGGDLTPAQQTSFQASTLAAYPGIQPVYYVHLDHSSEELLPTRRYNCWGFTFNPRQCWISSGGDVQNILNANGTQVSAPGLRVGDVVCYRDSFNVITHTGRVWSLDALGQASLVQSKWGQLGEYFHPPLTVPASYGTNVTYWRVTPVSGKGDAWHKDNAADDRLPCPPGVRWLSPDLWCNNAGGASHQDPVRGQPNQLYARIHNADNLPIVNATVRFYWADPNGGIPHTGWHAIGTATASAAPGTSPVAGPVTWTPGPGVPGHSCLLAIADTGDSPFAAATLDPIVWPFDVGRDNNIVQKNIAVVEISAGSGSGPSLEFAAMNPFPAPSDLEVRITVGPLELRDLGRLGLDPGPVRSRLRRVTGWGPRWPVLKAPRRPGAGFTVVTEGDVWRQQGELALRKELVATTGPVAPGKGGRLKLALTPAEGDYRPGQLYRIDLEQRVGGQTTGGMTYVVVVTD